ncbi:hypothetical protein [Aurantibacillus circumpalustris]|uniref:hypothetical protein n=1 Tax=Aurantibacillus circumpalustris TaxID=3036359 RepID=UPI00295AD4B5|nr:hypothetical protein [Aurantibacillus circumpalustris]
MKTVNQPSHAETHNEGTLNWFDKQAINFENARFGWMAILITAQSCLGSVACGFILKNNANIIFLCTCAAITMGCNALLIALAPPKVSLISVYLSVILNALFILFNL